MTTEGETPDAAYELVELVISSPSRNEPYKIKISKQESISSIKQYLIGLGPLTQPHTSFNLQNKGSNLDPTQLVGEYELETGSKIELVPEKYSASEATLHIQQTRELLGFVDQQGSLPAVNAGSVKVVSFKDPKKGRAKPKSTSKPTTEPEVPESHPIFGVSPQSATVPVKEITDDVVAEQNTIAPAPSARSLQLSLWNPVTPQLKLQGHLMYLKLVTQDGKAFHITAHRDGFTVNSSTDDKFDSTPRKGYVSNVSLLQLIGQISPATLNSVQRASNQLSKVPAQAWIKPKNSFMVSPWLVGPSTGTRPDIARTQTPFSGIPGAKDWNEDYQATRELPKTDEDGNWSIRDRLVRERLLASLTHEFAEAALKGAMDVVERNMEPLNPGEDVKSHIFLNNAIFYTYAADSVLVYGNQGGDEAARVAAKKDLRGVDQMMRLDIDGLCPVLTAVIDYCGRRIVAQGPVPGVFRESAESRICYGTTENKETVIAHEDFVSDMEKIADVFHLKPHAIEDARGEPTVLVTSMEVKGMRGTDGRRYILDVARLTPPDVGFLESSNPSYPHKMTLLRPEAVAEWFQRKVRAELKDRDDDQKVSDDEAKAISAKYRLNPDVSVEETSDDRNQVNEVSQLIVKALIPEFLEELTSSPASYPIDGVQLRSTMHRRGINMRYLGEIHKQAVGPLFTHLRQVVEQEAIVRSIKHIVNEQICGEELVDAKEAIVKYVSALLTQDESVSAQIKDQAAIRFALSLENGWESTYLSRPSLLRDVSAVLGLQWDSASLKKVYSSPSKTIPSSALVSIVPRIWYASQRSVVADEALEAGRVSANGDDAAVGLELVAEAVSLYEQVYGSVHLETARALNQAALVYLGQKDYDKAAELGRKAIVVSERVLGVDSSETLVMYTNLAYFERARGNLDLALELSKHALALWKSIGFPLHPDFVGSLESVASTIQETRHYKLSLPWFEAAIKGLEDLHGSDAVALARVYFSYAQSQMMVKDYKSAARSMEKSYTLFDKHRGAEDESTKETKKWLENLLSATIQDIKADQLIKTSVVKPQAPRAAEPSPNVNISGRSVDDIVKYIMGDEKGEKKRKKKQKKSKA